MSTTRNIINATVKTGSTFNVSGKVTNFSVDTLCFFTGLANDDDFRNIKVTAQLKNSKGSNAIIINSVPLIVLMKYSDFYGGSGYNTLNGDIDLMTCIGVDIGNIVLEGDDELDISISGTLKSVITGDVTVETDVVFNCFGFDYKTGPESIKVFDYIVGSATQTYQNVNTSDVYLFFDVSKAKDNPSDYSIAVNDYFGRNLISEIESLTVANIMARYGDSDLFGLIWHDDTGLTQDMSFTTAREGENFLVVRRFFDVNRIGMGQQSVVDFADYLAYVEKNYPDKYKCLQYEAKLNGIGHN